MGIRAGQTWRRAQSEPETGISRHPWAKRPRVQAVLRICSRVRPLFTRLLIGTLAPPRCSYLRGPRYAAPRQGELTNTLFRRFVLSVAK